MRKAILSFLLCILLSVSGCTGPRSADAAFDSLQAEYGAASGITMDITVTAAYTDTVLEYCLRYSGSGKGGTAEVLSPPSVAGLVMEIREADGILICDGMRLDTGIRGGPGITPVGICPVLWKLWTEGYGTQCRFETREGTETLALQLEGDDGLLLESWFDRDTHLPIFCGVLQDGVQVLTCSFSDAALIP